MQKNKLTNVLIVGVGGQGTILASDILAKAAMVEGLDVKKSEIHGMSQRGGSVFSHVRFGEVVHSPLIPFAKTDVLVSLEMMETLRWLDYTSKDTTVIYSNNKILPAGVTSYPDNLDSELKVRFIKLIEIEHDIKKYNISNTKFYNLLILGQLSKHLSLKEISWINAIKEEVPAGTTEENLNAFKIGQSL